MELQYIYIINNYIHKEQKLTYFKYYHRAVYIYICDIINRFLKYYIYRDLTCFVLHTNNKKLNLYFEN